MGNEVDLFLDIRYSVIFWIVCVCWEEPYFNSYSILIVFLWSIEPIYNHVGLLAILYRSGLILAVVNEVASSIYT